MEKTHLFIRMIWGYLHFRKPPYIYILQLSLDKLSLYFPIQKGQHFELLHATSDLHPKSGFVAFKQQSTPTWLENPSFIRGQRSTWFQSKVTLGKLLGSLDSQSGAFYVGLLDGTDGLLGVAGMICLIVSQWIIPENSLRLATESHWASQKTTNKEEIVSQWIIPSFPTKNNGFIGPIYLLRSHLAALRRLALVTRIHHQCKGTQ